MMINRYVNGLKGLYILAQGFKSDEKIVRAIKFFKKILLFRTKKHESFSMSKNIRLQFRPKFDFCSVFHISADGFLPFALPQGVALG